MLVKLALTVGLVMGAAGIASHNAAAAPLSPNGNTLGRAAGEFTPIEQVQFGRCRRWHDECRLRWGRSHRFEVCMRRHGC